MKFVLVTALLLACCSAGIKAQSCVTDDDVKQMLARVDAAPAPTPDKKLKEELIKMATRQRELLLLVVDKDQKKQSDQEKLHKTYDENLVTLCQLIKTHGWPTSATVDQNGVLAAFQLLKNAGTYEFQRDLLPVIVAAIKKDPVQKREFAGLYDRLRVSAGMKQLFGTQAVNDLGKVYSLGYKLTNARRDNTWRGVEVSIVNRTDLLARTRPGYYAQ